MRSEDLAGPSAAAPAQRAHSLNNSAATRPRTELQPAHLAAAQPAGPRPPPVRSSLFSAALLRSTPLCKLRQWGLCGTFSDPFLLGDAQSQDCKEVVSRSFHQSFPFRSPRGLTWDPQEEGLISNRPSWMFGLKALLSAHAFNACPHFVNRPPPLFQKSDPSVSSEGKQDKGIDLDSLAD